MLFTVENATAPQRKTANILLLLLLFVERLNVLVKGVTTPSNIQRLYPSGSAIESKGFCPPDPKRSWVVSLVLANFTIFARLSSQADGAAIRTSAGKVFRAAFIYQERCEK